MKALMKACQPLQLTRCSHFDPVRRSWCSVNNEKTMSTVNKNSPTATKIKKQQTNAVKNLVHNLVPLTTDIFVPPKKMLNIPAFGHTVVFSLASHSGLTGNHPREYKQTTIRRKQAQHTQTEAPSHNFCSAILNASYEQQHMLCLLISTQHQNKWGPECCFPQQHSFANQSGISKDDTHFKITPCRHQHVQAQHQCQGSTTNTENVPVWHLPIPSKQCLQSHRAV